ncbi:MAG: hypothetical protein LW860_07725 [Xanthomonadaceae bacterium]|nr:hypothetical protein [Xanthomonadaceae bacterium]
MLAAAIRAKAQLIVTFDEADFPTDTLAGFDLVTQHPGRFLCHLIDLAPALRLAEVIERRPRVRARRGNMEVARNQSRRTRVGR